MNKKSGFTLAEVLVTLVVIGIVAALTIPSLISQINDNEFYTKFKSDFSYISQAFNMINVDNGGDVIVALGNTSDSMMNAFGNKMVFLKTCLTNQQPGVCFYSGNSTWKTLYGDNGWGDFTTMAAAVLRNGSIMAIANYGSSCTTSTGSGLFTSTCGYFVVDVNGFKGPNIIGKDIFFVWVTKTGVYPMGADKDWYGDLSVYCNKSQVASGMSGIGCAAKVLQGGLVQ